MLAREPDDGVEDEEEGCSDPACRVGQAGGKHEDHPGRQRRQQRVGASPGNEVGLGRVPSLLAILLDRAGPVPPAVGVEIASLRDEGDAQPEGCETRLGDEERVIR